MPLYITETQESSKLQIDNITRKIKKIVKRDKKTSMDIIKLAYPKRRLNLCGIRAKIDAQRVKWIIEALTSPTDSIEYYLVNENLVAYKHHTIGEIKGFNLLRYRPPINKITSITSFYKSCLKSWYDINLKYRVKNQVELDKELIYLNPRILNDPRECYNHPKIHPKFFIHARTTTYNKRPLKIRNKN